MRAVAVAAAVAVLALAPELRAACTPRPTDAGHPFAYAGEPRSFAGTSVRVHWTASGTDAPILATTRADGVPETVAYAAAMGDLALERYAARGFRRIPSDLGCGGDDLVDIYLVKFAGADGSTSPECGAEGCSSYVLVDATFRNRGYADAQEGFRTVVSHELFHGVQYAYRASAEDPFWSEGTAQWAMKELHPELQDFERLLPGFFADTSRSIDAPPAGVTATFLYGSAVWPLFLATSYGEATVREIFETTTTGTKALDAIDQVLRRQGSSLADAYPRFAAWNAGTGALAGTGGYVDAASYPGVKTIELADGISGITSGLGYFVHRGTLTTRTRLSLDTDDARNRGVIVPLEGGKARIDRAASLPADAEGEILVIVSGTTTRKTDAPYTLRFKAPPPASPSSSAEDGGCRSTVGFIPGTGFAFAWSLAFAGLLCLRRRCS